MKNMRYLILLPFLLTAGCGGNGGFSTSSTVEVTDKNISPENPVVIKKTILGYLSLQNTNLKLDKVGGKYSLSGAYKLVDAESNLLSNREFSLSGIVRSEDEGASSLYPARQSESSFEQTRARITCLENDVDGFCRNLIVDFYLRRDGQIYATQVTVELEGAGPAAPEDDEDQVHDQDDHGNEPEDDISDDEADEHEGMDEDESGGLYVGTLHEDHQSLFDEENPVDEEPKPAPPAPNKPTEPKPVEPKPTTPAPAPSKPAEPKPVEPKPTTPAPAPSKPAEPKPVEPKPTTPAPAPSKPAEPKPVEPKPTTPAPAPSKPAEPKPVEPKPTTPAPAPSKPAEPKPVEPKPTTPAPAPSKPAEPKAEDVKPTPKPKPPMVIPVPRPAPAPTGPAKRPRDQAIGLAYGGRLEKATSLKDMMDEMKADKIHILYPSRQRYFGTYELVMDLIRMSTFLQERAPGDKITVGDLSQQKGGKLRNSQHKSHQNGLDVDISFPRKNDKTPAFTDIVSGRGVTSEVRLEETYMLFEYAHVSLQAVDRIFAATSIKRALCTMAKSRGMLDSDDKGRASEVLRRVRPEDGHRKHFHMRIRCSTEQPRCRMMAEPPRGSGCKNL